MTKRYHRSDAEWMELITQCRQSGLSDHTWCLKHSIPDSSFYNAMSRLRKKACSLPERTFASTEIDLTSHQDVVEIGIVPDTDDVRPMAAPAAQARQQYIDNSHMIEISVGSALIRIPQQADPSWLCAAIREIGRM